MDRSLAGWKNSAVIVCLFVCLFVYSMFFLCVFLLLGWLAKITDRYIGMLTTEAVK